MANITYRPESARHSEGIFSKNGEIFMAQGNETKTFNAASAADRREYLNEFLRDKRAQDILKDDFKITGFESAYKQYLFCKCGACNRDHCPCHRQLCQ